MRTRSRQTMRNGLPGMYIYRFFRRNPLNMVEKIGVIRYNKSDIT